MRPYITKEALEARREKYKPGTRVKLTQMDDVQAPPIGTLGTVTGVDDIGSIMVHWDTGSTLSVTYGYDECEIVPDERIPEKVIEQILKVRDSGKTNMLDKRSVQAIAFEEDYFELVNYIEEHADRYVHFILTGEA